MENSRLTPFQMVLFGALIIIIVIAVMIFAFQRKEASRQIAPITMWGTISEEVFNNILLKVKSQGLDLSIVYVEKEASTFEYELVESLALGTGPDIVILPFELLVKHENKLFMVDYKFYPLKNYKSDFIEHSEKLLSKNGIIGFPLVVDPLVLYWNRTILNSNGISEPPMLWQDFVELTPKLVRRDDSFNINRAAVGLGETKNINHAQEILSALIMQAGNDIITKYVKDDNEEVYEVILSQRLGFPVAPTVASLNFFTQFSNPANTLYTWNKSLPDDFEMFISNDLAFYIGFASEYETIRLKNPNLNFDISILPQRDLEDKKTFGKMQFLAILKNSPNISNAISYIYTLIGNQGNLIVSESLNLPPIRRDLLSNQELVASDSALKSFYDSALISDSFYNFNQIETKKIFENMIESYTSGRSSIGEAIGDAESKLKLLLKKYYEKKSF